MRHQQKTMDINTAMQPTEEEFEEKQQEEISFTEIYNYINFNLDL